MTRWDDSASAADIAAAPQLECYQVEARAAEIVPGQPGRDWMDATNQRFAYRCTPLSMANTSGWELLTPFAFEAVWNGGEGVDAIEVRTRAGAQNVRALLTSHFGHGILTFHPGWLFRTTPGWALWVRGAPNVGKDGIHPLDGLVETDWTPFTFTMNWRFLRPGAVRFAKGEPFCFITPCPHGVLDAVAPRIARLDDAPELKAEYAEWSKSRTEFNRRLNDGDPAAVAERWQKTYIRGGGSAQVPTFHVAKRRLRAPE